MSDPIVRFVRVHQTQVPSVVVPPDAETLRPSAQALMDFRDRHGWPDGAPLVLVVEGPVRLFSAEEVLDLLYEDIHVLTPEDVERVADEAVE